MSWQPHHPTQSSQHCQLRERKERKANNQEYHCQIGSTSDLLQDPANGMEDSVISNYSMYGFWKDVYWVVLYLPDKYGDLPLGTAIIFWNRGDSTTECYFVIDLYKPRAEKVVASGRIIRVPLSHWLQKRKSISICLCKSAFLLDRKWTYIHTVTYNHKTSKYNEGRFRIYVPRLTLYYWGDKLLNYILAIYIHCST